MTQYLSLTSLSPQKSPFFSYLNKFFKRLTSYQRENWNVQLSQVADLRFGQILMPKLLQLLFSPLKSSMMLSSLAFCLITSDNPSRIYSLFLLNILCLSIDELIDRSILLFLSSSDDQKFFRYLLCTSFLF